MEKVFITFAKAFGGGALIIVGAIALFRGAVPFLIGSHSDFGLLAGILIGVLGFLVLLYLTLKLGQHVFESLSPKVVINQQNAVAGGDIVAGNKTENN